MPNGTQLDVNVKANTGDTKSQLSQIIALLEEFKKSASGASKAADETKKASDNAVKAAKAYANSFKQRAKVTAEAEKKQNEWVANYQKMQAASQNAQQKMMRDMYTDAFKKYDSMQSQMAEQTKTPMQSFRDNLKNNGLQEFKNALKSMDYPFKNFTKSLLRIAKLRLLRGIIRSITGAFKEGATNLYYYSAALNSADGARFANSMNAISSSMLYLKNSIGAAVAPLITSLVPALQTVVNWLVTATQAVAQFFAALGGQVMYTRAKEYATTWKDVGSAVGGASAAAKEYENTILGFDELNVLNDPSQGGGGGGGGAAAPDYSAMFEEAEISKKIRDLTQWIKDNFEDIRDIALAIGGILLGWKIASSVANFMSALGFANAAGVRQLGLGLVLTITGVTLATKGGYDIGYSGPTLMNVIKTALGVGLAGAGGALAANAITSLGIASIGTGVGAAFGIGIALVGTIVGFTIGEGKKQREAIIAELEDYQGEIAMILNSQNKYLEVSEQAWSNYAAKMANLEYASNLTKQLSDLQQQGVYTSDEIDHIKFLIDELNGLGLEGITAQWDENTQTIKLDTDAIYKNIEALKEEYKQEAYREIYIQALRDQAEREIELSKATALQEKAQEAYNAKLATYKSTADALGISLDELAKANGFENTMLAKEAYALSVANQAVSESTRKHDEATQAVKDCEVALGWETTAANNATGSMNNVAGAVDNVAGKSFDGSKVTKGLSDVGWWADNASTKIGNLKWAVDQLGNTSYSGLNIGVTTYMRRQTMSHGGFVNGYENGGYIPSYATGGINSADMFLANENGNPELIGRIGNRTAVANQGQLVEALAQGFERTFSNMNSGSSNVEVVVNMDGVAVARAANRGQKSLNRRFNVNLA